MMKPMWEDSRRLQKANTKVEPKGLSCGARWPHPHASGHVGPMG
jgi:hypothetical protein